jgi:hypothetical protein
MTRPSLPVSHPPHPARPFFFLLLFVPALASCGTDAPTEEHVASWTLGAPTLRIGSLEGGETALTTVRTLTVGPEGRIHVLQPQDQEVRVFGPDGDLAGTMGREGEGPGEFLGPSTMGFLGDTLWVGDSRLRRIILFGRGGTVLETFPFPLPDVGEDLSAGFLGLTPRGGAAVATSPAFRSDLEGTDHRFPVLLTSRDGRIRDTLATRNLAHHRAIMVTESGGAVRSIEIFSQTFSDQTLVDLAGDGGWIAVVERPVATSADSAAYRVSSVTASGDTLFSAEVPYEPLALPGEVVDSIVDRYAEGGRSRSRIRETLFLPDHYPPVSDVVAGEDGTVWVSRERRPGASRAWDVFGPDGTLLARMEMPAAFRLHQARQGEVWGVLTDELDVPYVVRYPVVPQSSPPSSSSPSSASGASGPKRLSLSRSSISLVISGFSLRKTLAFSFPCPIRRSP